MAGITMKKLALILMLALGACSGGGNTNGPPVYIPTPTAGQWCFLGSKVSNGCLSNPFNLPSQPSSYGMIYAAPVGHQVGMTITLNYSIDGAGSFFVADTADTLPATITLFLWEQGDDLSGTAQYEYYRWYCNPTRTALVFGDNQTISCKIDPTLWTDVIGRSATLNPAGFQQALNNLFAIGFGLGGKSFDAHGVGMASGSASIRINSLTVQ